MIDRSRTDPKHRLMMWEMSVGYHKNLKRWLKCERLSEDLHQVQFCYLIDDEKQKKKSKSRNSFELGRYKV